MELLNSSDIETLKGAIQKERDKGEDRELDSGCFQCTSGAVPDKYATGPCLYHATKPIALLLLALKSSYDEQVNAAQKYVEYITLLEGQRDALHNQMIAAKSLESYLNTAFPPESEERFVQANLVALIDKVAISGDPGAGKRDQRYSEFDEQQVTVDMTLRQVKFARGLRM